MNNELRRSMEYSSTAVFRLSLNQRESAMNFNAIYAETMSDLLFVRHNPQ